MQYRKMAEDCTSDLSHITHIEAQYRFARISQVNYQLSLYLLPGQGFVGKAEVQFYASSEERVWLDLNTSKITTFALNGKRQAADWQQGKLYFSPAVGLNCVMVKYEGKYRKDGTGLYSVLDPADGTQYVFSQFQADFAHSAFPCFDQPDLKATFQLTVVAPVRWEVVSCEPGSSQSYQGALPKSLQTHQSSLLQEHSFPATSLISTYLFCICAGQFTIIPGREERVPVRLLYRQSMSLTISESFFRWIRAGLDYYEDFFQVKYPFTKLDLVFIAEGRFMAMENVGCITLSETYLYLGEGMKIELARACNTVLHELAHMWFGNLVTMRWWDDLWLNESFATYISFCCQSEIPQQDKSFVWRLFLASKDWGYESDVRSTTHPISVPVSDTGVVDTNFDGISYAKGSAVLKQLHLVVGEKVWRGALREYIAANVYGNTCFEDLIRCISQHCKAQKVEIDLEDWAEQWIKTSGLNAIQASWTSENHCISSFTLHQFPLLPSHPQLRLHKLQIRLYDSSMALLSSAIVTVLPQSQTDIASLRGLKAPACVVLNSGDFDFVKVLLDDQSLGVFLERLGEIPELINRQIVIKAIWDRVADNQMSGAEFIDRFLPYFLHENDFFLCEFLLIQLEKAAKSHLPNGTFRRSYVSRLFQACLHRLQTSPDPILRKVTLAKMFRFLQHPQDVQQAIDWLDQGVPTTPPIYLNQTGRWVILAAYAAISPLAKDWADREYAMDQTIQGKYYWLMCEAAYPVAGKKEEMWREITENTQKYSATELYFLCQGFTSAAQNWLFHPYFRLYSPALLALYPSIEARMGKTVSLGLIPHYAGASLCISMLDRHISLLPAARFDLRRDLVEAREDLIQEAAAQQLSEAYFYSLKDCS